ncbi:cytochrome P450 [Jiangella endophytica]|uniref:cytochrome P450 n=1 Tax=Jiangella endophytica TaxID=1623398 RepID=UPI001300AE55|nr:cytochrome P450 [Jiangella endophytica]
MTEVLSAQEVPTIRLDVLDPRFVVDPYPFMEEVRALGPVVRERESGYFLVTGYRDAARVMGLAKSFASDVEHFVALFGGATMECMDNPRHDQVKSIWAKDFQRGTLAERRAFVEHVVDEQTRDVIDRLRAGETVDAVTGMTRAIPTIIIATMMGVRPEDFRQFVQWSDDMGGVLEARDDGSPEGRARVERANRATRELNAYLLKEVARRRAEGGDDLVAKMATSDVPMAEDEIVASNTQLVFAGNETTSKLMGYAIAALAQHPEQRRELLHDRSLVPQSIEEAHRWTSVLVYNLRFVKEEGTVVGGVALPKDATVMVLQAAANRDPDRWDDPSAFDLHRPPQAHLGFGAGLHSCLGLNLARLETEVLINKLLDEVPDWEVLEPAWGTNPMVRGASAIPLRLPN